MFTFDKDTLTLTLDPQIQQQFMKGNMCPDFPYETLEFKVQSDILGASTFKFDFKVEPKGEVQFFNFEFDWKTKLEEE